MDISPFIPIIIIFFILAGFLIIYIIKNYILIRITNFEFYYLSVLCSSFIYFLTIMFYNFISPIKSFEDLIKSLPDWRFLVILLFSFVVVFIICISLNKIFYNIDLGNKLRKYFGREFEDNITLGRSIWDEFLLNYDGYLLIWTNDNEIYLGKREATSYFSKEKQVLISDPEKVMENYETRELSKGFGYSIPAMIFMESDIKRIALINDKNIYEIYPSLKKNS